MNTKTKENLLSHLNIFDPYQNFNQENFNKNNDNSGWNSDSQNFQLASNKSMCLEIGSWMGNSAKTISNIIHADGCLVCNDNFLGSHEHFIDKTVPLNSYNKPMLYEYFLKNTEPNKNKILPIMLSSSSFLHVCEVKNIKFDFIYIDGDHRSSAVYNDLKDSYKILNKDGIILIDDASWGTVKEGVDCFCNENNIKYDISLGQFIIRNL
jgi:hypothetical protein